MKDSRKHGCEDNFPSTPARRVHDDAVTFRRLHCCVNFWAQTVRTHALLFIGNYRVRKGCQMLRGELSELHGMRFSKFSSQQCSLISSFVAVSPNVRISAATLPARNSQRVEHYVGSRKKRAAFDIDALIFVQYMATFSFPPSQGGATYHFNFLNLSPCCAINLALISENFCEILG